MARNGRGQRFSQRALRFALRFPGAYEEYHSDNFGLRDKFLRADNYLKWFVLGASPTPLLIRGDDDWVYYEADRASANWRGAIPFTRKELVGWRRVLESRRNWLRERGIEYLVVLAPDKARVYPEHLPAALELGESRADQLLRYLQQDSDVEVLPLLEAIRAEKEFDGEEDHVYRRLGTHWTDRGARAGCEAIARRLAQRWPSVEPWTRGQYELRDAEIDLTDDWAGRLYLDAELERREFALVPAGRKRQARVAELLDKQGRSARTVSRDKTLPRGLVLHDSFGTQIRPFLSECFSEATFLWEYVFDPERIEADRPDVVVQLIVERALNFLPLEPLDAPGTLERRFADSGRVLLDIDFGERERFVEVRGRGVVQWRAGEGVELEATNGSAMITLPSFETSEEESVILAVELSSETDEMMDVLYGVEGDPGLSPRRRLSTSIPAGRSRVFVEVLASHLTGALVLRPGRRAGSYVLHSVEARSVPFEVR